MIARGLYGVCVRCERGDEVDCWSGLLECASCKIMLLLYGDCYIGVII